MERDRFAPVAPCDQADALARISAIRDDQKARGFTTQHDADAALEDLTVEMTGKIFDALRASGEDRKHAFAQLGALAVAAIEREQEVERRAAADQRAFLANRPGTPPAADLFDPD